MLGLNDTQESTLGLIFHWADERTLPLLDLKDLRAVIMHLTSDEGKEDLRELGGVSKATAGVILRAVTNLDAQGGDRFFGEPELDGRPTCCGSRRTAAGSSRCSRRPGCRPTRCCSPPS